jgi:hypothetical protein
MSELFAGLIQVLIVALMFLWLRRRSRYPTPTARAKANAQMIANVGEGLIGFMLWLFQALLYVAALFGLVFFIHWAWRLT